MLPFLFHPWVAFAVAATPGLPAAIDAVLNRFRGKHALSGTLVVERGAEHYAWSLDLADDDTKRPNTPDTPFLIASISKGFVAAAILRLADAGQLSLGDRLRTYLPEYPKKNLTRGHREVTLRDLLWHVSGVPEAYDTKEVIAKLDYGPVTFADMLRPIRTRRLRFKPGTKFEYSNTGYVLLGEVVHRVSGQRYGDYVREQFLEPLGLDHSSVGPAREAEPLPARAYHITPKGRVDFQRAHAYRSLAADDVLADTNIRASAIDLARWAREVTSGNVLGRAATAQMLTPHLEQYGFGWILYHDDAHHLAFEHEGSYATYRSWVRRYPEADMTIVWLSNQDQSERSLEKFIEAVASAALPTP